MGPDGLVAPSGGNRGLVVASVAPTISSPIKVANINALGANVHVGGTVYAEALERATAHQAALGGVSIHAYDDPLVVAGQGAVAANCMPKHPIWTWSSLPSAGEGWYRGLQATTAIGTRVVAVATGRTRTYASAIAAGGELDRRARVLDPPGAQCRTRLS